jgi:hypothetical protein
MKAIKHVLNKTAASIELWTKKYLTTEDYCTKGDTGDCPKEVKAFCKMQFGIDLLKELGAEETKAGYDASDVTELVEKLGFYRWNYEAKIELMQIVYVTSLMTKPIFCEYLRQIEAHYLNKEGLRLESINETLRNNALNIK